MRVLVSGGPEADKAAAALRHARITCDRTYTMNDSGECADSRTCDVLIHFVQGSEALEVASNLRADGIMTPLLFVAPHASARDKIHALDAGADDYLTQPFIMAELLPRVRALSRRRPLLQPTYLSFGDLLLDRDLCSLSRGDERTDVTVKEMQLLEQFLLNPHQILPRDRLLHKVWGYDCELDYNNIEVYISFLRKKLRAIGSVVSIRAKRGMGYFLDCPNK